MTTSLMLSPYRNDPAGRMPVPLRFMRVSPQFACALRLVSDLLCAGSFSWGEVSVLAGLAQSSYPPVSGSP